MLVVYNPRSSRNELIREEVLDEARRQRGWMVGRFEVKSPSLTENAEKLARLMDDGDLVVVAGGDGTASMVVNSALLSGRDVTLGVLGYGNFNDMGRMLDRGKRTSFEAVVRSFEEGEIVDLWPLDIIVNESHWRYAMCYVTMGMFAESTRVFDDEKVRGKLQKGRHDMWVSLVALAKWYLKNHKRVFLPDFTINGELQHKKTDYIAVNSPTMARILKGGDWSEDNVSFGRTVERLGGWWRLMNFMRHGMFGGMKLTEIDGDTLEFQNEASIEIHAEGEYERLDGVRKIGVKKSERSLKMVKMSQ